MMTYAGWLADLGDMACPCGVVGFAPFDAASPVVLTVTTQPREIILGNSDFNCQFTSPHRTGETKITYFADTLAFCYQNVTFR